MGIAAVGPEKGIQKKKEREREEEEEVRRWGEWK